MLKQFFCSIPLAAGLWLGIIPANAGTASSTLTVTATFASGCAIWPATLNFGAVASSIQTTVPASSSVNVRCSSNTAYTIDMDQGQHFGSANSFSTRRAMADGNGNFISYQIYKDSGMTQIWGSTLQSGGTVSGTGTGAGSPQLYTIYGGAQTGSSAPAPGTYSDVVTMTISY